MNGRKMNAKQLADTFTLEQLREAYDLFTTEEIFFTGDIASTVCIGSKTVVSTTPRDLGEAKLIKRGWVTKPRRRSRTRR